MTHEIKVCMGSACFAKGNQENLEFIKEYIESNGLDAKVSIVGSLCENRCEKGPRIYVNDVEHICVTQEKINEILANLE
ncbi:(2Fe-2S) ferredoxin domain-containing protein [bacterium]|nr:(2Fe-2S) ferredoxin domain-containing protein [bacterium]